MDKPEPSWDLYRSFLAVMRAGSLSGAARALAMTQPSLGRHIRELEAALDAALFTRSPQGLLPTELALRLVPHAEAMASATAALRRAIGAGEDAVRGVVRLTASEAIGTEVLPPMLTEFRREHPGVTIELVVTDRAQDLLRKDADLAIRMARPTQQALIARQLARIELGLFAHPRYLRRHGAPATLDELREHSLIGFDQEPPYLRTLRPKHLPWTREHFALRTDHPLAALAAMRAGYGIGICQVPLAARTPKLVRLLAQELSIPMECWVVMHEDLRRQAAVRSLFDYLGEALNAYAQS
ncbi:LysR family transcriptional regulator [Dyella marensis]|uniref:LysR family transcriptional regulator n=1 Tax=Dyella TaxID=231454 RepID=UPI001447B1D9|nr:LysR family transcriptional regulator [Dyella sp. SG609]NKJ20741.1 DNA-binding transcriptional LysR family regulator [Dyella sp. SG609]